MTAHGGQHALLYQLDNPIFICMNKPAQIRQR